MLIRQEEIPEAIGCLFLVGGILTIPALVIALVIFLGRLAWKLGGLIP